VVAHINYFLLWRNWLERFAGVFSQVTNFDMIPKCPLISYIVSRDELERLCEQKANLEYLLAKVSTLSEGGRQTYREMLDRVEERIAAISQNSSTR
jgi:hypothetical protein